MTDEDRIVDLLEELVAWTRLTALEALISRLRQTLADPKQLKAYELTDGTRTQREVGDAAGLDQARISRLYARWRRMGILREKNGKVMHLARPSDVGLDLEEPSVGTRSRGRGAKAPMDGADG